MMDTGIPADLIVIAAIAIYVVIKYRKVLGQKTGIDPDEMKSRHTAREESAQERVVQLNRYQQQQKVEGDAQDVSEAQVVDESLEAIEDDRLKEQIVAMKRLDAALSLDEFLKGARMAFEMVMQAFNEGDRATLKLLLEEDLYKEFDRELKQHEKRGQKAQTTLVSILAAEVKEAQLQNSHAVLSVRFLSEQIHVVRDKDDKLIEGDPSRIEQVEDEWVFERDLKSRNPNWTIADM